MAEPAAKKQKTEDADEALGGETGKESSDEALGEETAKESPEKPEAAKELEVDAKVDSRPKVKDPVIFHTQDTSLNVMPSVFGNMLMGLSDGGMQHLLAGARASLGVKSGRYMFEVKVVELVSPAEDSIAKSKITLSKNILRVGFSTVSGSLFLGTDPEGVSFDLDGSFFSGTEIQAKISMPFSRDAVVAVVLNLDASSHNNNTVSLFVNGARACQPQALPEQLLGQVLCPALTFKNVSVHYNFGPATIRALPFKCTMIQQAAVKDAKPNSYVTPKDGQSEVLYPVLLPGEGGFDWLDGFLAKNRHFVELSDRALSRWAEISGFAAPRAAPQLASNDKLSASFGVPQMDDGSVRRLFHQVAPVQRRHYVAMELKANLMKADRKTLLERFSLPGFKKVAMLMLGEPPADYIKRAHQMVLVKKQSKADAQYKLERQAVKAKKLAEKRAKMLAKAKLKAERERAKQIAAVRKKMEEAAKAKKLVSQGEDEKKEEEEANEPEEEDSEEEDAEEDEDDNIKPPKVELTAEEKKECHRPLETPDIANGVLSSSFTHFSVPAKDEDFDDIRFEWGIKTQAKASEYIKSWVSDRKRTTRVEDLNPSDWFNQKYMEWSKTLQHWRAKQNEFKVNDSKKAADRASKVAVFQKKKAEVAARKKALLVLKAKKEAEGEEVKDIEEPEEPEEPKEEKKPDVTKLDPFGVEDILNVLPDEPLFSRFAYEDWTMLSLRYELHLLVHAFRRDVGDPERPGITIVHLAFYYSKYYKKVLNPGFYGVSNVTEVVDLVKDTVILNQNTKVLDALLPDDMESLGVFAMMTEESRRDRNHRLNLGDESAKLNIHNPAAVRAAAQANAGAVAASAAPNLSGLRAVSPQVVRPTMPGAGTMPRPLWGARPAGSALVMPGARPVSFGQQWRPTWGR